MNRAVLRLRATPPREGLNDLGEASSSAALKHRTGRESADSALLFARRVHHGQHRKQTGEQFVEHPIAVAELLRGTNCDEDLMKAAYLHDVVEKTEVETPEIRDRFGERVASVVEALTEDPALPGYAERKRALRAKVLGGGRDAVVIYAADRLANMRDWSRIDAAARPACADRLGTTLEERLELWSEDLLELTRYDPDLPFLAEIEVELRGLRATAAP